ncbi:MAG: carbon-nitrogen hydrolase, partial [Proteobacteria bacterium]
NTLRIFGPAGHLGDYSKIHLFGYGGESESYTAGNSTLTLPLGEIGASFFICYDLRFPAYFSKAAPQTHLYVVVANWPKARLSHFLALARARAIENQAYVAAVNRVGNGGGLEYTGGSTVFTPKGEVLAELGDEEGVLKCDISPQEVEQYRREFPFLRDRVGADLFSQG